MKMLHIGNNRASTTAMSRIPFQTIPLYQAMSLPVAYNAQPVSNIQTMFPAIESNFISYQTVKIYTKSDIPSEFAYYFIKKAVIMNAFIANGMKRHRALWSFLSFFKPIVPLDKLVPCLEMFFGKLYPRDIHTIVDALYANRAVLSSSSFEAVVNEFGLEDVYVDGGASLYQLLRLTLHFHSAKAATSLELPPALYKLLATFAECPQFVAYLMPFKLAAYSHFERITLSCLKAKSKILVVDALSIAEQKKLLGATPSDNTQSLWFKLWKDTIYNIWNMYQLTYQAEITTTAINMYFEIEEMQKLHLNQQ